MHECCCHPKHVTGHRLNFKTSHEKEIVEYCIKWLNLIRLASFRVGYSSNQDKHLALYNLLKLIIQIKLAQVFGDSFASEDNHPIP